MANYYDVYTTLMVADEDTKLALEKICDFCKCPNDMETLKKALWKKPSRVENPGAFPFDENTGKIYDVLWRAAQKENYGTAEKIGRFLMKLICPPAEDEGMGRFHAKYHEAPIDENETVQQKKPVKIDRYEAQPSNTHKSDDYTPQDPQNEAKRDEWKVDDDEPQPVVISRSSTEVSKRTTSNKKND